MEGRQWRVDVYGGAEQLKLVSVPVPQPGPGQVLLRVLATTATYTDSMILHGNYRPKQTPPVVPGYDCIADVAAVGEGVTTLREGDRVAAMPQGMCAQTHLVLPADACIPISKEVAPQDAVAVVLTGVTAYQMLHRLAGDRIARDPTRATVLVHGCVGGTGAMIVELAKAAGVPAANIYGTCSSKNMGTAARMGIRALDYTKTGAEHWATLVMAGTNGVGVDVVFDAVVLNGYLGHGLGVLKRGGKYVAYGVTNTAAPGSMSIPSVLGAFTRLWWNNITSGCGGTEAEFYQIAERRSERPTEFNDDLRACIDMVASGKLNPLVGRVWGFEEARDAWVSIESNTHVGKQIIIVQQ